jgi:hypothetical protein
MSLVVAFLLLAGAPFWETTAPKDWTAEQLEDMLRASPWAKTLEPPLSMGGVPSIPVYLATATPVRAAEVELLRRAGSPAEPDEVDEYRDFLRQNAATHIVLAIQVPDRRAFSNAREVRRMEEQSFLKIGKKKHGVAGHFPPSVSDPWLRLVFPRDDTAAGPSLVFDLYLPGAPAPYRTIQFFLKELTYRGKPDF